MRLRHRHARGLRFRRQRLAGLHVLVVTGGPAVGCLVRDADRVRKRIANLAQRASALGGEFSIGPRTNGGTTLVWRVPGGKTEGASLLSNNIHSQFRYITLTPDGRIVFPSAGEADGTRDIWIMNSDGAGTSLFSLASKTSDPREFFTASAIT